jgi:hypothetical protein
MEIKRLRFFAMDVGVFVTLARATECKNPPNPALLER